MVAINIALINTTITQNRFGAPGLLFFRLIFVMNAAFITLLGISFFATAISEEKEEDTLGLMQMAGINPLGILLGKLGGRLVQALLLVAVQYPFTLLAITMGGVSSHQIQAAFLGLAALVVFQSGLGLLCSTVAGSNRESAALMVAGMLAYVLVPLCCREVLATYAASGMTLLSPVRVLLSGLSQMCLFLEIGNIMTTNYTEPLLSLQVISNSVAGLIGIGLAWALFPWFSSRSVPEGASRGLAAKGRGPLKLFAPGRVWANPFVWKDFFFVGGGWAGILCRVVFYPAMWLVLTWSAPVFGVTGTRDQVQIYFMLVMSLGTLDGALLIARVIRDEIRGRTVSTLVMLPGTVRKMIYSKIQGAALAVWPVAIGFAIASSSDHGADFFVREFLRRPAGYFFLAHFALTVHLAMVLALYLRWGSVGLAICGAIGSVAAWVGFFESIRVGPGHEFVWVGTVSVLGLCAFSHFWVMTRFARVAD